MVFLYLVINLRIYKRFVKQILIASVSFEWDCYKNFNFICIEIKFYKET